MSEAGRYWEVFDWIRLHRPNATDAQIHSAVEEYINSNRKREAATSPNPKRNTTNKE